MFPPLRADAVAVYIGGAARVDGRKLAAALAGAAVRQGAVVRDGEARLAFDDGRIVAGATRETGSGFDYRVTPAGLAEILEQALAVAPGLAGGTYLETRVGFRPMGPGLRPLLGPVPGLAGLIVATGLGASGLTMGPLAGSLAAQAALGLPPALDLEPFAP